MTDHRMTPMIRAGLDFFRVDQEGKEMIALRDPLGITKDTVMVPPHVFFIIANMDGHRTVLDLQTAFTKHFGQLIMGDEVEGLIKMLDEKDYLMSPRFQKKMDALIEDYRKSPVRPSALAGQAYPDNEEEVRTFLDNLFAKLPEKPADSEPEGSRVLTGLVAPHIDLQRGGHLFARAYDVLRGAPPPETALIFGTAHYGDGNLYILTEKDFETPLGRAQVDHDFCAHLAAASTADLFQGELAHRTEHSVEFQVLLLQYLFGADHMPKIVPVLCSSLAERLEAGQDPAALVDVQEFRQGVERAVKEMDRPLLVVAGADMCHVGARFGGKEAISPPYLERVGKEDQEILSAAAALDRRGFYRKVAEIENRNNICSVTSIYTLLTLLEGSKGEMVAYDQTVDDEGASAVGFAALNFFRDSTL